MLIELYECHYKSHTQKQLMIYIHVVHDDSAYSAVFLWQNLQMLNNAEKQTK